MKNNLSHLDANEKYGFEGNVAEWKRNLQNQRRPNSGSFESSKASVDLSEEK